MQIHRSRDYETIANERRRDVSRNNFNLNKLNTNVIFSRVHFSQRISMKIGAKRVYFVLTRIIRKELFSYNYKSQNITLMIQLVRRTEINISVV